MKTNFRVFALGMGITSLVLCVGCQGDQARANGPIIAAAGPSVVLAPAEADAKPAATVPVVKNESPATPASPAVPPGSIIITKATATNSPPATNIGAAPPAGPPTVSPALAEVVRLIEANVGQDVVMAYITNSTQPFNLGANEIVYLHDLGVPPTLITTLINIDSSPEMAARKQAATAVKPLPPGVALNEPATNVFIPKGGTAAVGNPPEPLPVNPPTEASVVYTPAPAEATYDVAPPATEVNNSYFYTSLAPYGSWFDVPGYGYCWRPTCATWNASWRPYGDSGRWLWSNQGWYWYSDYSWGWAPFHYGRWCRPAGYGWCWVPDTCWGPSWVSWRSSSSYCGWAPLPPTACYTSGFGFSYHSASVGIGFEFGLGAADYCYIPTSRFCDRRPCDYFVSHQQHYAIHKDTTVINNYVVGNNNTIVNNGVGFDRVAKVTRGDIRQVALRDTTSMKNLGTRHDRLEADGKTLTVYRPPTATLAHKSVVSAPRTPGSTPVRPTSNAKGGSGSVPWAGKSSFTEPVAPRAPFAHAPAAQTPAANSYNGNSAAKARTAPTPVTVYTKPVDAGRQPVIITGGSILPPQYGKPAAAAASDAAPLEVEPPRSTKPGAPGLANKYDSSSHAVPRDTDSPLKGMQQPHSGYTKPAAGDNGSSSKIASAPTAKAPGNVSAPGVTSAPKSGQARIEPGGGYQKPVAPQAPVARSGPVGPPPSAAPAQNNSRPAPSYSAPARVESHQSRVAPPSSAPSSSSSSSPRASAPSAPSGAASGGTSGGNSGKSSGSSYTPSPSPSGKGR